MEAGTRLIHPGNEVDEVTGAVSTPIYQSVIFAQKDSTAAGKWEYTRTGNPTRYVLEETIAQLEGGKSGFAFASGMAAITASFFLFSAGDHVLVSRDVYGGTYRLASRLLPRFGIRVEFIDTSDIANLEKAIKPDTRGLFMETPSNPLMKITDFRKAAALARENRITTICDNTLMTPYLMRPLELGIDVVVHSATKYLGGHSDCLAGLVVTADEGLGKEIRFIQNAVGAVLGPHDSWLIIRGLKTLKVRIEQQQTTASLLAGWLENQPEVVEVNYPGLPGQPGREIHDAQAEGVGGVFSFRLPDEVTARKFVDLLTLPVIGTSLGAVESIVTIPAAMSHAFIPKEVRQSIGLTGDLVRLSVGLEDVKDLQEDLAQALRQLNL